MAITENSKQPTKVYKYQKFNEQALISLCNDELYFSDPTAFNDPLDCNISVEVDSSLDVLRKLLIELVSKRITAETVSALKNGGLKGQKAENQAIKLGLKSANEELNNIQYNATNPEYGVNAIDIEAILLGGQIETELKSQNLRGVCCFSKVYSSLLLWSHYGNQHKGLCIGYGINRIPVPKLNEVVYGGSRIVPTSLIEGALLGKKPEAQKQLDEKLFLRKARDWSDEREWRLLGNVGINDSCLELVDITFGLKCSSSIIHTIVSALENRKSPIKFYETYNPRGSDILKRRPVELDELRINLPNTAESAEEIFGHILTDNNNNEN
jgi:hypothetical protein